MHEKVEKEFRELAESLHQLNDLGLVDDAGRREVLKYGAEAGERLVKTADLWEDTSLSSLKDETVPEVQGVELSKAQKYKVRQSHLYALWIKYCHRLDNDGLTMVNVGRPEERHGTAEVYMDGEYSLWPIQARQFALACSKIADKLPQLIEAAKKRAKPAKKRGRPPHPLCEEIIRFIHRERQKTVWKWEKIQSDVVALCEKEGEEPPKDLKTFFRDHKEKFDFTNPV